MNFLAHIYLSDDKPLLQIGNFIADSVKGRQVNTYPLPIQEGIRLHRAIDAYTDAHPAVATSVRRLRPSQGKFAAVVVDIFYDHFLAKDWGLYHKIPLEEFTDSFYAHIQEYYAVLPQRVQEMLPYMVEENWLLHYRKISGIRSVLEGMAQRTRFDSNMRQAHRDLEIHYKDFQKDFDLFFPDLQNFTKEWSPTL